MRGVSNWTCHLLSLLLLVGLFHLFTVWGLWTGTPTLHSSHSLPGPPRYSSSVTAQLFEPRLVLSNLTFCSVLVFNWPRPEQERWWTAPDVHYHYSPVQSPRTSHWERAELFQASQESWYSHLESHSFLMMYYHHCLYLLTDFTETYTASFPIRTCINHLSRTYTEKKGQTCEGTGLWLALILPVTSISTPPASVTMMPAPAMSQQWIPIS